MLIEFGAANKFFRKELSKMKKEFEMSTMG